MWANSRADSTMPRGVSPKRFMIRSDSDPWLVPMRIALPSCLQSLTSGVNFSLIRCNSSLYCWSVYSRVSNFFLSA